MDISDGFFRKAGNGLRTCGILGSLLLVLGLALPVRAQVPQDEKGSFDLAQKLYDDASYANAAQEFRRFIISFPTSDRVPDALLRMGQAYFRSHQDSEAIRAFQQYIDRYPNRLEMATAMRLKAEALEQSGEYTKAGAAYQAVHDAFPGGEYAPKDLLSAGTDFHRGKDLDDAEAAYRALMSHYPKSPLFPEAAYRLGLVLLDAGRNEEARVQFHTVVDFPGATDRKPDALLEIGRISLSREDLSGADHIFEQLRKGFPQSTAAQASYLATATWFTRKKDWSHAADVYTRALQVLPRNEIRQQAVLGLAEMDRKLDRSDRSLSLYTEFLKAYPDSPFLARARLGLGRAYVDLKKYREALEAFDRLQEAFPDSSASIQAYSEIGGIWRKVGAPRKALSAYRAYRERVEDPAAKASAALLMARIYGEDLRWYDRAEETYRKLAGSDLPEIAAEAQFGLAWTFENTGRPNLAIREYRTYLQKFPYGARAEEAETRIRYLREFAPLPGARTDAELVDLVAGLPAVAAAPEAQFRLGGFLYRHRDYSRAVERLKAALSGKQPPSFAPEAEYLLGESCLKLAGRARLEGQTKDAAAWRDRGLAAYRQIVDKAPRSDRADDATVALIEAGLDSVRSDSVRAVRILKAYRAFQDSFPHSDRLDFALLRIADAQRLAGKTAPARIDSALQAYRGLISRFPDSPLKEQAAYGIGVCQAMKKQYADAEETFRSFIFAYPQSDRVSHAQFQLGRLLLERGFDRSAAEELSELLSAPGSLELERSGRALLAESYSRMGDYARAIRVDESLLQRDADPAVYRRLAHSYRENKQPDKALRTYTAFLSKFPDAADADSIAFARAELLATLNRTSEAISAFQTFEKKFPHSPLNARAGQAYGDLLFQEGKYQTALAAYRNIPAEARTDSVAGREVLCLYRLKQVKEAGKEADAFRKKFRNDRGWLARLAVEEGQYTLDVGNPKKARGIFEDVVKDYAGTDAAGEASYGIVRALHAEGRAEDYVKALVAFVKDHTKNPHWAKAALELADLYYKEEDYGRAARAYQSALEGNLSPDDKAATLARLVAVHKALKLYDTAIAYARQLVQEFPQDKRAASARIDIGTMQFDKGDYHAAIQELTPLLKTVKKDEWSLVQYTIAQSYFKMGDYESAKREFFRLQYDNQGIGDWIANAHDGLAKCYKAQGDYRAAIQELEKIQQKFGPSSPFSINAETRIQELQAQLKNTPQPQPDHQ